jgi:hypothetical protein
VVVGLEEVVVFTSASLMVSVTVTKTVSIIVLSFSTVT